MSETSFEPMMLTTEVAEYIGMSEATLRGYRVTGKGGPSWVKLPNGLVRYRRRDVDAWINGHAEAAA